MFEVFIGFVVGIVLLLLILASYNVGKADGYNQGWYRGWDDCLLGQDDTDLEDKDN